MKKFYFFVSNHRTLTKIAFSVITCAAYSLILWQSGASLLWYLIGNACLILTNSIYVQTCDSKLIQIAAEELTNACDPMPLLAECDRQLERTKNDMQRQAILITKTAALANTGELEAAYQILNEMNIDKHAGTLPLAKLIYYHNFAYVCHLMGKWELADAYHQRASTLYHDLRSSKQRQTLNTSMMTAQWEMHLRHGEHSKALAVLDQIMETSLQIKVDRAWGYGCVYFSMGNIENAAKYLSYVADYPKLYIGRRASQMLDKF